VVAAALVVVHHSTVRLAKIRMLSNGSQKQI
jgi:hypothetical protein